MDCAILTIGSEILQGQITDRNSHWLAGELTARGYQVRSLLSVDDEIDDIANALGWLENKGVEKLFLTGGLGPTTDDITRQAVAKWAGVELEFDDPAWARLQQKFRSFDKEPADTNKRQCWFPQGAEILTNNAGTADGFELSHNGSTAWILPGPPRELHAIWQEHIIQRLNNTGPRQRLRKWRTVGLGESDLAEMLEPILEPEQVLAAYRAHAPFVETKIMFPATMDESTEALYDAVDHCLAKWLIERDDDDNGEILAGWCERFDGCVIHDAGSGGHLTELIGPGLRRRNSPVTLLTSWDQSPEDPEKFLEDWIDVSDEDLPAFGFANSHDGGWAAAVRFVGFEPRSVRRPAPYGSSRIARNKMAGSAQALAWWIEQLALFNQ